MKSKTLKDYLKQKYDVRYIEEEDCWFAEIEDLPGCMTQGDTYEETKRLIESARRLWIKTAFQRGIRIPEPGERTQACQVQYRLEIQPIRRKERVPSYAIAA